MLFVQFVHPPENLMVAQSSRFYSPKLVAKAIGVSESSLKRWCDRGRIRATKTAGGHRRMTHSDIIEFVKNQKISLQNPEAVDLPSVDSETIEDPQDAQEQLYQALISGDAQRTSDLLIYLYVNVWPLAQIVDEIIAPSFEKIGRGWESGKLEVYQERRACEICSSAIRDIRAILPRIAANAPKAIGGSVEQDPYSLPTLLVEATLLANGWNARSFGSNIPFASLREALFTERPNLVWMSVSHIQDQQRLQYQINEFAALVPPSIQFVIGGQAITPEFRNSLKSVICCDNMSQLIATTRSAFSDSRIATNGSH